MKNLFIRKAEQQIIEFLNGLACDIEVKRLIVRDIYDQVRDEADRQVLIEAAEADKVLKEKESKDGKEAGN